LALEALFSLQGLSWNPDSEQSLHFDFFIPGKPLLSHSSGVSSILPSHLLQITFPSGTFGGG
jgi:hypothetical protein